MLWPLVYSWSIVGIQLEYFNCIPTMFQLYSNDPNIQLCWHHVKHTVVLMLNPRNIWLEHISSLGHFQLIWISVGFQLEISNWIPTEIQMNWKRPNIEMCSSHMFLGFSITIPTTCGYPITQNIHLAVHRYRVADLDVGQAIHIHDAVGLRHVHQGVNV